MGGTIGKLVIQEADGTPSGTPSILNMPNGSLTDNGDGSFTYAASGGTGLGMIAGAPQASVSTNTYYSLPFNFGSGSTSESGFVVTYRVPAAGVLRNLYVKSENSPTNNTTATVRINGSDSALTCTITGGTNTGSDTSHTVSVSAGDYITFKLVGGGGATACGYTMFSIQVTSS